MVSQPGARKRKGLMSSLILALVGSALGLLSFGLTSSLLMLLQSRKSHLAYFSPSQLSPNPRHTECDLILSPEEYPPSGFCGPRILIVGAMKCGTNQLRAILVRHPQIVNTKENRETHFFTHKTIQKGADPFSLKSRELYASLVPRPPFTANGSFWTYDKSPSYLSLHRHPQTPHLAKRMLPSAKVIVTLCEPAVRLWSQYNHMKRHGQLPRGVDTIDDIMSTVSADFDVMTDLIALGFYGDYLKDWITAYGKQQVFVVDFDKMTSTDPAVHRAFVRQLLAFLGLPANVYDWDRLDKFSQWEMYKNPTANYTRDAIPPHVLDWLRPHYEEKNAELAEYLGADFPRRWNGMYNIQKQVSTSSRRR